MKLKVLLMTFILASCASMHSPSPQRKIASAEPYTPQEAIADALSGELKYLGWALLPGSDTVGSCTYYNDKAYVIWHYCSKSKKEMPVFNVDVLSYDGRKINFFVENSEKVEFSKGKVSKIRRSDYDANWTISFMMPQQKGPSVVPGMTLPQLRMALTGLLPLNLPNWCFAGGTSQTLNIYCSGEAKAIKEQWGGEAGPFWTEPNEEYYTLIKKLRLRTSQLN